jgi:hypothetical protein
LLEVPQVARESHRRRLGYGYALVAVVSLLLCSDRVSMAAPIDSVPVGPAEREGALELVDAGGRPVAEGNSDSVFSVKLPADATCPGDTQHDQWRWWIFLAPEALTIDDVRLGVIGPENENSKSLYTTEQRYGADQFLLPNSGPGQPGRFPTMPFYTWTGFPTDFFPNGNYRVVVLCSFFREPDRYWDTEVQLENTSTDGGSAAFRWTVLSAPDGAVDVTPRDPFNWKPLAGAGIALAAAALAFALWRSSNKQNSPKEPQP